MSDRRQRERPPPVRALDDESRRLIRPRPELLDERTMRLHDASTEPERSYEGSAQILELRSRDPERMWLPRAMVDDVLKDIDNKRAPAPVEMRRDEPPTMPDRTDRPSSDVFQSIGAGQHPIEVDLEAPTPLERRHRFDERPTDLDVRLAAPTATYHPARDIPVRDDSREQPGRDRHAEATARERRLVEDMYASERKFVIIQAEDPQRAQHIESLATALKTSAVFQDRQRVLAIHGRERAALESAAGERHKAREDQVIAMGLVARELDDGYRDAIKELRVQLVNELETLPADKRDAVYADFDSFIEKGGANDSHFCRRELHQAMNDENVLHKAYVYALALDQHRPRPETEVDQQRKPNE